MTAADVYAEAVLAAVAGLRRFIDDPDPRRSLTACVVLMRLECARVRHGRPVAGVARTPTGRRPPRHAAVTPPTQGRRRTGDTARRADEDPTGRPADTIPEDDPTRSSDLGVRPRAEELRRADRPPETVRRLTRPGPACRTGDSLPGGTHRRTSSRT